MKRWGGRGGAKTRVLYKSNFLLNVVPSFTDSLLYVLFTSPSIASCPNALALPSSLADPGLRYELVRKVVDGETFIRRALLDAST